VPRGVKRIPPLGPPRAPGEGTVHTRHRPPTSHAIPDPRSRALRHGPARARQSHRRRAIFAPPRVRRPHPPSTTAHTRREQLFTAPGTPSSRPRSLHSGPHSRDRLRASLAPIMPLQWALAGIVEKSSCQPHKVLARFWGWCYYSPSPQGALITPQCERHSESMSGGPTAPRPDPPRHSSSAPAGGRHNQPEYK
jgi:hypothetical protein